MKFLIILFAAFCAVSARHRAKRDLKTAIEAIWAEVHFPQLVGLVKQEVQSNGAMQEVITYGQGPAGKKILDYVLTHPQFKELSDFGLSRNLDAHAIAMKGWNILQGIKFQPAPSSGDLAEFYSKVKQIVNIDSIMRVAGSYIIDMDFLNLFNLMKKPEMRQFVDSAFALEESATLLNMLRNYKVPVDIYIDMFYKILGWK